MREIHHLNLLNQVLHTLHKPQMRRVLVHIIFSVAVILKLDYKCMCDAVLIYTVSRVHRY